MLFTLAMEELCMVVLKGTKFVSFFLGGGIPLSI